MSVQINQIDHGGDFDPTANIEAQRATGGPNSSIRYSFQDLIDYINSVVVLDLDAVLVAGNDAAGIGITELASIDNLVNDFELTAPQGVDFYFGSSPGGIFGLDAFADQMQFTADQWYVSSSDASMFIFMDIDFGYVEMNNQTNFLRVTEFDIEVGSPILGYSTTSETVSLISTNRDSIKFKPDKVAIRTTTALPTNTVGGSNTTLIATANGAFPAIDGVTLASPNQDVLVCNEASQVKNGVYRLTQVGTAGTPWILTRRGDSNVGGDLECAVYNIEQGTRFSGTSWKQITIAPVLGSSNIVFKPFGDNIIEDSVSGYYKIVSTSGVLSTTSV